MDAGCQYPNSSNRLAQAREESLSAGTCSRHVDNLFTAQRTLHLNEILQLLKTKPVNKGCHRVGGGLSYHHCDHVSGK